MGAFQTDSMFWSCLSPTYPDAECSLKCQCVTNLPVTMPLEEGQHRAAFWLGLRVSWLDLTKDQ